MPGIPDIQYYLKETTNQILVSGSSPINTQLNAIKDPTTVINNNYTSKLTSLGTNISYVVQNGIEFTNLILNQNLPFTSPTTSAFNTVYLTKNGSINGVGAILKLRSLGSNILSIQVTDIGSGYQVGETITFTQSELLAEGFTNVSSGIVITLTVNNIVESSTEIPLRNDQELWVYRGYNTSGGDGDTYRYNPHLHRPYKAYIVTETGSGAPSSPYRPLGGNVYTSNVNSNVNINNVFLEGTLSELGNGVLNGVAQTNERVSGSFQVFHDEMLVYPWVFTQYTQISQNPPSSGAFFRVYLENATTTNNEYIFKTTTSPPILAETISYNNATPASVTTIYVGNATLLYPTLRTLSGSVETFNKNAGKIKVEQSSNTLNSVTFDISGLEEIQATDDYMELTVTNPVLGTGYSNLSNNTPVKLTLSEFSDLTYTINQNQGTTLNIQPEIGFNGLRNGDYTYTSSFFSTSGTIPNSNDAVGTSQFGLCTNYGYFVNYKVSYNDANLGEETINVNFSSSTNDIVPNTFDLLSGYETNIVALIGSISTTGFTFPSGTSQNPDGTYISQQLNITIENNNANNQNIIPPDLFATRWSDAYISFSQSLSSSIDGLYVFNQLPQNDVQVTASMFLTSWTGSDDESAKYATAIYATDVYGEGEAGDGPTWPTASIRLYTGSYPFSIPTTANNFVTESLYKNANIHLGGYAITMSYLIPSQSLNIKDCLSLSLQVSSGSANSASVENSLVVQYYQLEFNTPPGLQDGDGLVPTVIENAFSGSNGFDGAVDCQPFLNNVIGERENREIQIVNYSTDPYTPSNFQLILSGSALKSTVPASNYTQITSINSKYVGSRSTANDFNLPANAGTLDYSYGNVPVVDYQNAYFAYAEQVTDPYPVINDKVQFNIKYLINGAGDANNPNLSPYTAFDIKSTWVETTDQLDPAKISTGRVAMNQQEGSTAYNFLNGDQEIEKVAQQLVPILYSQTSSNGYQSFIPLKGQSIPEYTQPYTEYGMNYNGALYVAGNNNDKTISIGNLLGSVSAATLQAGVSYLNNFGPGITPETCDDPIITNTSCVVTTASLGVVNFVTDPQSPAGSTNGLSAPYSIEFNGKFPTTPPQEYRTDAGGWNDGSDYNGGEVGTFEIKIQAYKPAPFGFAWRDIPLNILEAVTLTLHYAGGNTLDIPLVEAYGSQNVGLINNGYTLRVNMLANKTRDYATQNGQDAYGAQYATLNVGVKNAPGEIIRANRSYRINVYQYYRNESIDAMRNYWNPTSRPQQQGGQAITPAVQGPFVNLIINSHTEDEGQAESAGSMVTPFWVFSDTNTPNLFVDENGDDYPLDQQIYLSNANNVQPDPGSDPPTFSPQPFGNDYYNSGRSQQSLKYTPGPSSRFPGGFEPADTVIPNFNIPWSVNVGDQIRFINDESQVFNILAVQAPQTRTDNQLLLLLDRGINPSVNKDFFIMRRWIFEPSSIVMNQTFPYAELPTKREFIPSTNFYLEYITDTGEPATPQNAAGSVTTSSQSGSIIETYSPLLKKNNTPSGFLFPNFPIKEIELAPDEAMRQLRDNKLID
jgi:hypothetical protein